MMRERFKAFLLATIALGAAPARAADADRSSVESLRDLSIEQLAQIEVRSVSKQAEPISAAPASIFVITDEDIAHSAATSLPDVLRLAPALEFQHLDARQYAISARGFNGAESSNKLLVLVDGRSVYTTLHSGVFWELQSPLLEDLAQIEVVSGPGGTLYGPNAVNGVINIVTKDAHDTLGGLVRGTAGGREQTLAARYGFKLGTSGAMRFYADGYNREDMPAGPAGNANDRFKGWQAGFRADWGAGADAFTVQGDAFDQKIDPLNEDGDHGHNLLARWTRQTGGASSMQVQAYYDDYRRQFTQVTDALTTMDVEAQYNRRAGAHQLVLGGGLRTTHDLFVNNLNPFVLRPDSKRLWLGNVFAQERLALTGKLDLIAGLKLEHSSFSGLEVLPNLRFAWRPNDKNLLWTAVSRAVRTPSRIDRELQFLPIVIPATDFQSEKLIALEAGYRGQPSSRTTLSVSLYYNLYDDIRTTEAVGPSVFQLRNNLAGQTYGVEAWLTQQLAPWWRMSLGATTVGKHFHLKHGVFDITNNRPLGTDPGHQFTARSSMELPGRLRLDVDGRAVGAISGAPGVPAYVEADARLGWQVAGPLELYVAGGNLLHRTHLESNDPNRAQRIARSVYAGTRLRF
jgi:iron complex outermembrane receptor protein